MTGNVTTEVFEVKNKKLSSSTWDSLFWDGFVLGILATVAFVILLSVLLNSRTDKERLESLEKELVETRIERDLMTEILNRYFPNNAGLTRKNCSKPTLSASY